MRTEYLAARTFPAPHRPAGFTRVELLVGLAALAFVGLLALADVGQAGSGARRVLCLDNLRRLAGAAILYAADNQDHLPHPTWGTVGSGSSAGPGGWCYATYLPDRGWMPSVASKAGYTEQIPFLRAGQLWRYVGSDDVFLCPEDVWLSVAEQASFWRQRSLKLTSFTMNGAVINFGNLQGSTANLPGQAARTLPLSRFAPNAFMLWEADESAPFFFSDAGSQPHEGLSGRHGPGPIAVGPVAESGNGSHVGLFDGSARYVSKLEFIEEAGGTSGSAHPKPKARPNRAWCAPDSLTGGPF